MGYDRKCYPFETKAIDKDKRTFEGYASTFEKPENHDSHGDILAPTAFEKTIAAHEAHKAEFGAGFVKILYQHDPREPIGVPLIMSADSRGLYVKGKISKIQRGDDVLEQMDDTSLSGLSIGFDRVADTKLDELTKFGGDRENFQVRQLDEVDLWEFSPVVWGSNRFATVKPGSVVKSRVEHHIETLRHAIAIAPVEDVKILRDALDALLKHGTPTDASDTRDPQVTAALDGIRGGLAELRALIRG